MRPSFHKAEIFCRFWIDPRSFRSGRTFLGKYIINENHYQFHHGLLLLIYLAGAMYMAKSTECLMNKQLSALGMPILASVVMSAGFVQAEQGETKANERPNMNEVVLEPVVVTGENTDRSMRDTASSVMVITDEDIADMPGITSSNKVLQHIPNVVTVEPGNDAPAVRGVDGTGPASGANAFFAGTRSRLNYQVDGRALGFNESVFQDASLWDVEQVEVFRGPQSTQQGRNSIAGAIVLRTKDPSFEWEGKVRGMVGEQETRGSAFVLSGPLVDNVLAFRLAADRQTSNSDVAFTPYEQELDPELYKSETLRGKLLFKPNADVRSMLTIGYTNGQAPQSQRVIEPYTDKVAQFPKQPTFSSRNHYGIWDTHWTVSNNLSLEMKLSATDFRTDRRATTGLGNVHIDGKEKVFQPLARFRSNEGEMSGFVAAYIFRSEQDETIDMFGGGHYRDETDNNSMFGELTWWFSEDYALTLGARYETEDRYRQGSAGPMALDFNETYREFLPKATLSWEAHEDWTLGFTAGRGYNGGGAGITFSPPFVAYTYDPEFVSNYEAFMRGSLLGGRLNVTANLFYNDYKDMQLPFNLAANSTVIRNAEKATTYGLEAGIHYTCLRGTKVFANLALLKTKVDRYNDPSVEGNELARAPAFSLDLGFAASPLPNLDLSTSVRYTDAYYSDANNTPRAKVDAYALANVQASYTWNAVRFSLTVDNLFDSDDVVSIVPGPPSDSATLLKPRTITAGLEYRF